MCGPPVSRALYVYLVRSMTLRLYIQLIKYSVYRNYW